MQNIYQEHLQNPTENGFSAILHSNTLIIEVLIHKIA